MNKYIYEDFNEKSFDLGKHANHKLTIELAPHPHHAKLMCATCNKHIAWLNQRQTRYLTGNNFQSHTEC